MMRKIILLFALLLSFMGGKAVAQQAKSSAKILVAYFSYSGNTRTVAEQIQKATGADIFEIKVKDAYPSDYQELLDKAKKQIENHTRPALVSMPKNLSQYDIILIGSPNWWSTIAPPVATFLFQCNSSAITLVPFVTHGGGRMAKCETDIKALCPKAKMLKGLAVNGSSVQDAAPRVEKWLRGLDIIK